MSNSFMARLLDTGLEKTLGIDHVSPLELTPEEQEQMCRDWVGKKVNISHDRKKPRGTVEGSWFNQQDGSTHVIISTDDSEEGKKAADAVREGKLPSVSAGWAAMVDNETGEILKKCADHVALCKTPVYKGSIVYGVASNDDAAERANVMIRTAGGLGIVPIEGMNASIVLEKKGKETSFFFYFGDSLPPPKQNFFVIQTKGSKERKKNSRECSYNMFFLTNVQYIRNASTRTCQYGLKRYWIVDRAVP
jgi:hypothetical protein